MTIIQTFWISLISASLWKLVAVVDAVNFISSSQFLSSPRLPTQTSTSTLAFVSQPNTNRLPIIPTAPNGINGNLFIRYNCRHMTKHPTPSIQLRYDTSCAQNHFFIRHRQHTTPLFATTISDNSNIPQQAKETIQRLELDQQFERWKFMQCLLEGEILPSDIEDVLLLSLSAYLQHGPTAATSNNKDENGGNASPVLNDEQKSDIQGAIKAMLEVSDIGDSKFLHLLVLPPVDYESITIDTEDDDDTGSNMVEVDSSALSILEQIEQLLPNIEEDEDAYKSAWDVVIDLYGRESIRVNEEALQRERESGRFPSSENVDSGSLECCADSLQWRTLCAVGRVLIHFDFLTKGILNENTFRDE